VAKLRNVLIMAGGTGGHVFPGLAVAKRLRQAGVEVNWLGTEKGLESKLVPEANIPIHFISISGLRGKGIKDLFLAPGKLMYAIYQSIKIIQRLKPDVIIGLGGFVSGPGGIASYFLRIPLIIQEQNAVPGTTNKWLAKIAKKVLEGFPNTFRQRKKVITIGNPVREEIVHLASPQERFRDRNASLRLLVVGGSLGAAAINQLVPKALAELSEAERPHVFHQTGEKHLTQTQHAYEQAGIYADLHPFIKEMDKAYGWADIVLCRAGALTVSELCAAGLGAILVPFPYAIDDHQTANANVMAKENAAWLVQQVDLTPEKLADFLKQLYADRNKCVAMAQSAYKLRKIDAADEVLRICQEICQ
jgi:UDP-N-acetylglucosamine--N-acetylmuramyl-(pentapeptide) pyrophosphoryl-undecaprenol N-acetylglucosamine transferase